MTEKAADDLVSSFPASVFSLGVALMNPACSARRWGRRGRPLHADSSSQNGHRQARVCRSAPWETTYTPTWKDAPKKMCYSSYHVLTWCNLNRFASNGELSFKEDRAVGTLMCFFRPSSECLSYLLFPCVPGTSFSSRPFFHYQNCVLYTVPWGKRRTLTRSPVTDDPRPQTIVLRLR